MLRTVKLIAEPWDCGPGGYQVGGFPPGWAEWNDKFRDTVRDFWRGEAPAQRAGAAAVRLGRRLQSPAAAGPGPASISSPRMTASRCNDLVSYNDKHNEANGEDNRDGTRDNRSWNCGAEGPTDDAEHQRAARAADAQHAGHAAAVAGHADAAGRRRIRPHAAAATTTPTARTTRSAGSTGTSAERGQALIRFVRRLIAAAPHVSHPAPQPLPHRRIQRGARRQGRDLDQCQRRRDAGGDWRDAATRCFGMLIDGRAQPTGIRQRGKDATMLWSSTPSTTWWSSPCPCAPAAASGRCSSTPTFPRQRARASVPARSTR